MPQLRHGCTDLCAPKKKFINKGQAGPYLAPGGNLGPYITLGPLHRPPKVGVFTSPLEAQRLFCIYVTDNFQVKATWPITPAKGAHTPVGFVKSNQPVGRFFPTPYRWNFFARCKKLRQYLRTRPQKRTVQSERKSRSRSQHAGRNAVGPGNAGSRSPASKRARQKLVRLQQR